MNKTNSIWQRLNNLIGIYGKIMCLAVLLLTLLGGWITWRAYTTTSEALKQQLKVKGISIARDVAARSAAPIFTNNIYELHRLTQDTINNNQDIVYLFILDEQGNILVQSAPDDFISDQLRDFNVVSPQSRFKLKSFNSEQGIIHDIAVPIFDGRAGTVRLGLGEAGLQYITSRMILSLGYAVAVALVIGLAAAYLLANLLMVSLRELIAGTKAITSGNFNVRVDSRAQDEIGQLSRSFNLMAQKLDDYKKENLAARSDLERKEKLRIQLVERLITAQEEERKRVARELHDETAQSLTAMKLGLKVIEDSDDLEQIKAVSGELREILGLTLDEVSSLARNLRPSILDDIGMEAAICRYVEICSNWLGRKVIFKSRGLKGLRFPSYVETAVYRIIQEALTNALKYAGAQSIRVDLSYENELLIAVVQDDGIGFTPAKVLDSQDPQIGLGLFGMQERAAIVGGVLAIDAAPGKGTSITLKIRLSAKDNSEPAAAPEK